MDQKQGESFKRASRKRDKCREELHDAPKDEVIEKATALLKAEAAYEKVVLKIVESA